MEIYLKLLTLSLPPMNCKHCGERYLISQSALCSSHQPWARTEYDYTEKKRIFPCCKLIVDFTKPTGRGCIKQFHEPKNPPAILAHLVPKRYKLIREESEADLEEFRSFEFINPESVNGAVGLNTYKNQSVQVVEGKLESDHENSDQDDDLLYSVFDMSKAPLVKVKAKKIQLTRHKSPTRLNIGSRKGA